MGIWGGIENALNKLSANFVSTVIAASLKDGMLSNQFIILAAVHATMYFLFRLFLFFYIYVAEFFIIFTLYATKS